MAWGSPALLFLALAVLPLILLLNSLRPRGTRLRTTAMFLLERALRQRPLGKRLGWLLRKNLLLFLQLAAATALIAALGRPSLLLWSGRGSDIVAVVDLSASMKAGEGGASRFEAARRELLREIASLGAGQRMMLIAAGPSPRVLSFFTADKPHLRHLARSLQPTDAPAAVKEAILFAHAFLRRGGRDRVVVFSDGAFEGAAELPWGAAHLRMAQALGGSENVGILRFEIRRLPATADRYQALLSVKNFSASARNVPAAIEMGGREWVRETIPLAPGERKDLVYDYRAPLPKRAVATLEIADHFATDNRAYLALAEAAPLRLLYVGRGNPFLERLFRALPFVEVESAPGLTRESLATQSRDYDAIVVDGVSSPPLERGNFILINTVAGLGWQASGKIARPRVLPGLKRHPLSAGLRLEDLSIREALAIKAPPETVVLARSAQGPLLLAVERRGLRALVLAFDLLDSDLPYRVAFPLLFSNALRWLRPLELEFPSAKVEAGKSYSLPAAMTEAIVTRPSGKTERLSARAGPLLYAETLEVGFYRYRLENREGEFAVNLFDEAESNIAPRLVVSPSAAERAAPSGESAGLELWPYLLVGVLALLGIEAVLAFRGSVPLHPALLRAGALAALLAALYNPLLERREEILDVVVAADASLSAGRSGLEAARQLLEEARPRLSSTARVGLLTFAGEPAWEFFPQPDPPRAELALPASRAETNIQTALEAALGAVRDGAQARLVLISDGNENAGDALSLLPMLKARRLEIWPLPVQIDRGGAEVAVSALELPREVARGSQVEIRAAVESLSPVSARVRLFRDGRLRGEKQVLLASGTNHVEFSERLDEPGVHRFEVLVEAERDTLAENNLLQNVVQVRGPPRALYLHSPANEERHFARLLTTQGFAVTSAAAERARLGLAELAGFDLVVLDDVPAYELGQARMEALERYVRDLGGGLIVLGGPQSYGAGGYWKTPLERVLPVEVRPPSRVDLPQVAILFVLDKSGSMGAGPEGGSKLELAKSAALAAADLLNPEDQVGILTFDASWEWLLPFRPVGKGEWVYEKLATLQSEGGTDLYKALVEAFRAFKAQKAAVKHLLILSDGLTDKVDFDSLLRSMTSAGITVSTVAIGRDADVELMRSIAKAGKGRSYFTADAANIPHIFTSEALLTARNLIVEKAVQPQGAASGPLRGLRLDSVPPLRGYILTHSKPTAAILMRVGEDPLLASWRYGLGQVVAYTSDISGRWGREWLEWAELPRWSGQLARSVAKRPAEGTVRSEVSLRARRAKLRVDLLAEDGGFVNQLPLRGVLTGGSSRREIAFEQTAPGRYEGQLPEVEQGIHFVSLYDGTGGPAQSRLLASIPLVAGYPEEYRQIKTNARFLSHLAEGTGGRMIDHERLGQSVQALLTPSPDQGYSRRELWHEIAGAALLLLLADLAARRWPGRRIMGSGA